MKNFNNIKSGFTLTEMLLAIAIIGVISALIVPTVIRNYNRTGFENQLGSFYNDFTQAMSIAQSEKGSNLSLTPIATGDTGAIIKNYMQVKQSCGDSKTPCFADKYKAIDDLSTNVSSNSFCEGGKSFLLNNGIAICITPMTTDNPISLDNSADILVDLNGEEKPNVGGKDMFRMNLYADATIDEGVPPSLRVTSKDTRVGYGTKCTTSASGEGCFTQYMNDKMKITYYN